MVFGDGCFLRGVYWIDKQSVSVEKSVFAEQWKNNEQAQKSRINRSGFAGC